MKPHIYSLPEAFLEDGSVPIHWKLYALVNGFWIGGKTVYATNEWLAKKLGCTERHVARALGKLEDIGLLTRNLNGFKRTLLPGGMTPGVTPRRQRSGGDDASGHQGDDLSGHHTSVSNSESLLSAAKAAPAKPFSSEQTKQAWYDGDKEDFQLLAWFFDKKGLWPKLTSKPKVEATVNRHIRAARRIIRAGWSQEECKAAIGKMLDANPKMKDEYTLETLEKYLTK